jgi:hypothetical protein
VPSGDTRVKTERQIRSWPTWWPEFLQDCTSVQGIVLLTVNPKLQKRILPIDQLSRFTLNPVPFWYECMLSFTMSRQDLCNQKPFAKSLYTNENSLFIIMIWFQYRLTFLIEYDKSRLCIHSSISLSATRQIHIYKVLTVTSSEKNEDANVFIIIKKVAVWPR